MRTRLIEYFGGTSFYQCFEQVERTQIDWCHVTTGLFKFFPQLANSAEDFIGGCFVAHFLQDGRIQRSQKTVDLLRSPSDDRIGDHVEQPKIATRLIKLP